MRCAVSAKQRSRDCSTNFPRRWRKRRAKRRRTTWRSTCANSRSEEHTSELQSLAYLVCRLLLEKKKETRVDWGQCGSPHSGDEIRAPRPSIAGALSVVPRNLGRSHNVRVHPALRAAVTLESRLH